MKDNIKVEIDKRDISEILKNLDSNTIVCINLMDGEDTEECDDEE